jgi:histone deacetylase 11
LIPLVYHPGYNITALGLERLHPFDSRKYRRIHDALIARRLRRRRDFVRPRAPSRRELLELHTPAYLNGLRSPNVLAQILEVPIVARLPGWLIDWRILRPMRLATGGTLLASRLALEHSMAINLGGGFHHAAADWGGGFCVYADIPWAAAVLHREGRIGKVMAIDLDAHQGNGTAAVFTKWSWASIFDAYQGDLFPSRKEPEDYSFALPGGTTGGEYLDLIRKFLPNALDAFRPDLVIYNAGSDPFVHDPLAGLRLTKSDLTDRDLMVFTLVRERSIPVVMVLSGGYSTLSWQIHADAIEGILTRFDK